MNSSWDEFESIAWDELVAVVALEMVLVMEAMDERALKCWFVTIDDVDMDDMESPPVKVPIVELEALSMWWLDAFVLNDEPKPLLVDVEEERCCCCCCCCWFSCCCGLASLISKTLMSHFIISSLQWSCVSFFSSFVDDEETRGRSNVGICCSFSKLTNQINEKGN